MSSNMQLVYRIAEKNCGLKEDDIVIVTKRADNYEYGWLRKWEDGQDECILKKGIVRQPNSDGYGVYVWFEDLGKGFYLPFFVLKKVEKEEYEFKPYQRVLCKNKSEDQWIPEIFSMKVKNENGNVFYRTVGRLYYSHCIPYNGNEDLVEKVLIKE